MYVMGMTRCRVIVKGLFRSFYVSLWLERCLGEKNNQIELALGFGFSFL
jgi:hypothetical protein